MTNSNHKREGGKHIHNDPRINCPACVEWVRSPLSRTYTKTTLKNQKGINKGGGPYLDVVFNMLCPRCGLAGHSPKDYAKCVKLMPKSAPTRKEGWERCECLYAKDGKPMGQCHRCVKMVIKEVMKAKAKQKRELIGEIEKVANEAEKAGDQFGTFYELLSLLKQ